MRYKKNYREKYIENIGEQNRKIFSRLELTQIKPWSSQVKIKAP